MGARDAEQLTARGLRGLEARRGIYGERALEPTIQFRR
jgi:hypothetical protein